VINNRDKSFITAFGKHLRQLRLDKGVSQHQLAFEAGINKNMVGNIERGEVNTTISTLLAMARVLDVHPRELLDF
jgi:transcriptional regulator with XRE-family HTH domain